MRCRVCIIGPPCSGKSELFEKFTYIKRKHVSIGTEFGTVEITLKTGNTLKMYIWDTIGLEKHKEFIETYVINSDIVLVVFDTNSFKSAENMLESWLPFAEKVLTANGIKVDNIVILGVQTYHEPTVSSNSSRNIVIDKCIECGYPYFECSADYSVAKTILHQIAYKFLRACEL